MIIVKHRVMFDIHLDITTTKNFDSFLQQIKSVDVLLGCVDNFAARAAINQAALELDLTWFETGVSESAVSGHVQLMRREQSVSDARFLSINCYCCVAGLSACFSCAPPLCVANDIDERTLKRENVCAASLPTTMGLISSMAAQAVLKLLLGFGRVSPYIAYNALLDFVDSRLVIRANPECENAWCRKRQLEKAEQASLERSDAEQQSSNTTDSNEQEVKHTENEWGIVSVSQGDVDSTQNEEESTTTTTTTPTTTDNNISLTSLREQLKNIQS
jgi:ubiquitin-like modifier-activating enzyme 5